MDRVIKISEENYEALKRISKATGQSIKEIADSLLKSSLSQTKEIGLQTIKELKRYKGNIESDIKESDESILDDILTVIGFVVGLKIISGLLSRNKDSQ